MSFGGRWDGAPGMVQPDRDGVGPVPGGRSDGDRDGVADVTGSGRDGSEQGVENTGMKDGADRPKRWGEKA